MLWGDGWQAPATAQMRLIWVCPTGTGGLSGGRDGLVIGALGETGQLKKGEGELAIDVCSEVFAAGIEWLPALSAAWHWPATSWVNSRTMQAGSSGLLFGYRFRC